MVLGLALAGALSGCTSADVTVIPTATPPPGPAANSCPASGAAVSAGATDAALGVRADVLLLTNCGSAPYMIDGYPGVELLDGEQRPINVRVQRGSDIVTDPGPAALTLPPGSSARAILSWRNTVTDGTALTSDYLAVTPSAGDARQVIAKMVDVGTTGVVSVTAWNLLPTQPPR